MSLENIYGPIIDPDTVEKAVAATIAEYVPFYLGEMERLKGYAVDQIARPAGVITASEFAKWDEDALPLVLIISPGLTVRPKKLTGRGGYEATWAIDVCVIVSDTDELLTRQLMGSYAAAVRALTVQHASLRSALWPEGFASDLNWADEKYSDIPFADSRTLDSCRVSLEVSVQDAVIKAAGPRQPPETAPGVDPGQNPQVTSATAEVDLEPLVPA